MLDNLRNILAYKSLWSLATTTSDGKMRVKYYVSCLVTGRDPLWGVWDVNGRFIHFGSGREAIGKQHPNLSWRRVMAKWQLDDDADSRAPSAARRWPRSFTATRRWPRFVRARSRAVTEVS